MVGSTVLIMKDKQLKPIACLNYCGNYYLKLFLRIYMITFFRTYFLPNGKKRCRKESRGRLMIAKTILRNCRTCKTLKVGWIDFKKTYDMMPYSWVKEAVELVWLVDNIKRLLFSNMEKWKTFLTANSKALGEVSFKRGIFQGATISPILFIIVLIPLSMTFQEIEYGYNLEKQHKINHLLFIDDLRLYRKNERELNSFIITVNTFSEYTDVTFCMDKCKVLVIQQGRKKHSDGLKMPDGDPRK